MSDNMLKKLNFSSSIRAQDINNNFDTLHKWIARERKRIGGYGIVEGFNITPNTDDFSISVSEGVLITKDGEEHIIPAKVFDAKPIAYRWVTEKIAKCPSGGIIKLPTRPYSPSLHGYFEYVPPLDKTPPSVTEFYVTEKVDNAKVPVNEISDQNIRLSLISGFGGTSIAGRPIDIHYLQAEDRVDIIMINENGEYMPIQVGKDSTNPSHVDLDDYPDCLIIGIVHWQIGTKRIYATVYTEHRTLRTIYVNDDNKLYIYGNEYKDKVVIYFEEPDPPKYKDIWYDESTNELYFYDGNEWRTMNDKSAVNVRTYCQWTPDTFPGDCQTFLFDDIMATDMSFVPGKNVVEIIVDNVPLMQDQFEELTEKVVLDKLNGKQYIRGIGFKLKDPLDKPCYVECMTMHPVKTDKGSTTFEKAALFVAEDHITYNYNDNPGQIFKTTEPYILGDEELEVWVNGRKLIKGTEFVEMITESQPALPSDYKNRHTLAKYFKIQKEYFNLQSLSEKQEQIDTTSNINDGTEPIVVAHKITKHVWSYDQVNFVIDELLDLIKDCLGQTKALRIDLTNFDSRVTERFNNMTNQIQEFAKSIPNTSNYISKEDKISINTLSDAIKARLVSKIRPQRSEEGSGVPPSFVLKDCKPTDYIQVYLRNDTTDMSKLLIEKLETAGSGDYTLSADGKDTLITFDLNIISGDPDEYIYVTGLNIGGVTE